MRILIMSDSHSGLQFMHYAIVHSSPDMIIHLGDYYEDSEAIAEDYPNIPMYRVPGNCDLYRYPQDAAKTICATVQGVRLYMTHGHLHRVKQGLSALVKAAREAGADAVLYGHTHIADCHREEDGLWVINPGSCRSYCGSVAIMELEDGKILSCRILEQSDLEDYV